MAALSLQTSRENLMFVTAHPSMDALVLKKEDRSLDNYRPVWRNWSTIDHEHEDQGEAIYKAACRLANFDRSEVAKHTWQDGHNIEWNNVEKLETATGSISKPQRKLLA